MLDRRGVMIAAVVTGVALEIGIHLLSGRREAWDSPQFWVIGLPAAVLISAVVGYRSRSNDWIWTALIVPSQVTTMMVSHGDVGGLWPLTVAFSSIFSLPFVIAAFIGSRFRPADSAATRT
jgi:hypothetical protein